MSVPHESISVLDIFKIGVGPSSSHTMGPWRAAQAFHAGLQRRPVKQIQVELFGSLAKTGRGHGTDFAVILGLAGEDPVECDVESLAAIVGAVRERRALPDETPFDPASDLRFNMGPAHPGHPNTVVFTADLLDGEQMQRTFFSVGGGFVVEEGAGADSSRSIQLPHPIQTGDQLLAYCREHNCTIPEIVRRNELAWRPQAETDAALLRIWRTMLACAYRGCHTDGVLPGGLNVTRRAKSMHEKLLPGAHPANPEAWLNAILAEKPDFASVLRWVSCFALAVNEENAAFGRVVTAPTNGAAGVIPAVLIYSVAGLGADDQMILDFLLTAGEVGSLFKKGATISAAMGGCQAEIGVSSAMAAAGLCQVLGGSPEHVLMAAEIAMEHHLGMTCDPIGGLVQIPCIERNSMGAVKAITAASLALDSDPTQAKVSLDGVIATMWQTARDMNGKYKETAEGGLAVQIPVIVPEC